MTFARCQVSYRTLRCHDKYVSQLVTITVLLVNEPIILRKPRVRIHTAVVRLSERCHLPRSDIQSIGVVDASLIRAHQKITIRA